MKDPTNLCYRFTNISGVSGKIPQDGSLNEQISVPQSDAWEFLGRVGDQEKARCRSSFKRWTQF